MKKVLSLLMLFIVLVSSVSCQGIEDLPSATNTAEATTATTETAERTYVTVPDPLSWDDINAIPIANASMSVDELRKICTDYFRLQLSFRWTGNDVLDYVIATYDKKVILPMGKVYAGLPYVTNATGNLYILMKYYDSETGVLDVARIGGKNLAEVIGNQCSFGSSWGWARVCNTITSTFTNTINDAHGWVKLGNHTYDGSQNKWNSTKEICKTNGEQTMYESYALFREADCMVTYNNAGHTRMVSSNAHVVRDSDGKINGKESYVTYLDQGSSWTETKYNGTAISVQGGVDVKVTFEKLFSTGYLPFTTKEFLGTDPIEEGSVSIDYTNTTATPTSMRECIITANYPISHVDVSILDANGNQLYTTTGYPQYVNTFELAAKYSLLPSVLTRYAGKGNTLKITCQLGNGENLQVFSGELIAE